MIAISYMAIPSVSPQGIAIPSLTNKIGHQRVIDIILDYYGFKWKEIDRVTRKRDLCMTRHVIMYFLRKYTKMSLREVGHLFACKYDHTTVINAVKVVNNLIDTGEIRTDILKIQSLISEG